MIIKGNNLDNAIVIWQIKDMPFIKELILEMIINVEVLKGRW
jgi:hypothetical protein